MEDIKVNRINGSVLIEPSRVVLVQRWDVLGDFFTWTMLFTHEEISQDQNADLPRHIQYRDIDQGFPNFFVNRTFIRYVKYPLRLQCNISIILGHILMFTVSYWSHNMEVYIYMKSSFAKTDKRHFKKKELIAVHYSPYIVRSEP